MTEQEFIERFVIQMMATYASSIYDECCQRGQHERLERLPIEDAVSIAKSNWGEFKKQTNG